MTTGPLTDKRFVVTGTLGSMSREAAAEAIRNLGGTFQSAVSKDTTYLVAGANTGTSKLTKAKKYGVAVINEKEMIEILKTH